MAQRATGVAKKPGRAKTDRADAPDSNGPGAEAELDESIFASLTADLCSHNGDAQPFTLQPPPAGVANAGAAGGFLARKGEAGPSVVKLPGNVWPGSAARDQDDGELRRLHGELATLEGALAERDGEVLRLLADAEQAHEGWVQEARDAWAKAEQAWKADFAAQLAAAEAEWREESERALLQAHAEAAAERGQSEAEHLPAELAALKATLAERESALAKTALAARQAQQESEAEFLKAKAAWQADEAARLAAAEGQWREQSARALAETRAAAAALHNQGADELSRLRDECADLQAKLSERNSALAELSSASERARESLQRESEAALAQAKAAFAAGEAARLATAEAQWREHAASALAEARAAAAASHDQAGGELSRLRDERTALQATLSERDGALAELRLAGERARVRSQQELESALAKAKADFVAGEAERLAAAEVQWREQYATALAAARAKAALERDQGEGELGRLRDECAGLQATLSERDRALAELSSARESAQQESEAALAKAKAAWEADDAARLAAAEAQWREQSATALAEARAEAATAREQGESELRRVRDEHAAVQASLSERDRELAELRSARFQGSEAAITKAKAAWEATSAARLAAVEAQLQKQSARAVAEATARAIAAETALAQERAQAQRDRNEALMRPNAREAHRARDEDRHAPPKRGWMRDIFLVAALAVVAIMAYPSIAPFLPQSVRSNIDAVTGPILAYSRPESTSAPNAFEQHLAVVDRDVNVRANPSTTGAVISTLARGAKVTTLETRGNWTLVQIEGSGNAKPRQGWVFGSYLKDEEIGDEIAPEKPK